jgi:hypothetical protein
MEGEKSCICRKRLRVGEEEKMENNFLTREELRKQSMNVRAERLGAIFK